MPARFKRLLRLTLSGPTRIKPAHLRMHRLFPECRRAAAKNLGCRRHFSRIVSRIIRFRPAKAYP